MCTLNSESMPMGDDFKWLHKERVSVLPRVIFHLVRIFVSISHVANNTVGERYNMSLPVLYTQLQTLRLLPSRKREYLVLKATPMKATHRYANTQWFYNFVKAECWSSSLVPPLAQHTCTFKRKRHFIQKKVDVFSWLGLFSEIITVLHCLYTVYM